MLNLHVQKYLYKMRRSERQFILQTPNIIVKVLTFNYLPFRNKSKFNAKTRSLTYCYIKNNTEQKLCNILVFKDLYRKTPLNTYSIIRWIETKIESM